MGPADEITIVLLPNLPASKDVLELAREWTSVGLLRRGCWVRTEDMRDLDTDVPTVTAQLLSPDGEEEGDLFTVLGGRRRRLTRLVAAHLIPTSADADPAFADHSEMLGKSIRQMLPMERGKQDSFTAQYRRISLVIPASGVSGADASIIRNGWDGTVVAAPEDRVSPHHPADFVRPSRNFAGHALLHIAAAGGLLNGVGHGTFDEPPAEASASYGRTVTVARVWARTVLGQRTTDELADLAMQEVMDRASIPFGLDQKFVASSRPDVLVAEAGQSLQRYDSGLLLYRRPPDMVEPGKGRSRFSQAVHELLRFCGAALRMYGSWLTRGFIRQAERHLTEMTYGAAGAAEVRLRPDSGSTLAWVAETELVRTRKDAHSAIGRSTAGRGVPATPDLWSAMRGVSLGLLDGDMPAPFDSPVQGTKREVVIDRGWIVPEPSDTHVVPTSAADSIGLAAEHVVLRSCDARGAAAVGRRLAGAHRHLAGLQNPEHLSSFDESLGLPPTSHLGTQHPALAGAAEWRASVTKANERAVHVVHDARQRLSTWVSRRERSLLWRLASDTGEALDRAQSDTDAYLRVVEEAGGFDPSVVDRARKRFLWLTTLILLLTVGGVALVWLVGQNSPDPSQVLRPWQSTSVVAGLALLAEALVLRGYYRAHSAFERALNVHLHRIRHAVSAALTAMQERTRLSGLYDQLLDWADILGAVAYGPWDLQKKSVEKAEPSVDEKAVPFALRVAAPHTTGERPRFRDLTAALSMVVRPGWMRSAYSQLVDVALDEIAADLPARMDMVDKDVPTSTNRMRRMLLDALTEGRPQHRLAERTRDLIAQQAVSESADLSGDVIRAISVVEAAEPESAGSFVEALLEPPPAFAHHVWSSEGLVSKQQVRGHSVAWLPRRMTGPDHPDVERREVAGRDEGVLVAVMRCDYSQVVGLEHLKLFSREAPDEDRPDVDGANGTWV